MADLTLKPVLPMIARIIETQLRKQAPVKTGTLRSSVAVRTKESPDGFAIVIGYLEYGRFLDSGTGRYRKPNPKAPFNPRPGKGRGGIKPRYWTNLGQAGSVPITARIAKMIKTELTKQIRQSFKTK